MSIIIDRKYREATPEDMDRIAAEAKHQEVTGRIENGEVLKAFRAIGWIPRQARFGSLTQHECCGITAIQLAHSMDYDPWNPFGDVKERLGLSEHYVNGFMSGWDGQVKGERLAGVSKAWSIGYDDGYAALMECSGKIFPGGYETESE